MMKSLRQTMLNLLAAGLFHLTEQQLAQLSNDAVTFRIDFDNATSTLAEPIGWTSRV